MNIDERRYTKEMIQKKYDIKLLNKFIRESGGTIHILTRQEDIEECYAAFKKTYPKSSINMATYAANYYIGLMSSKNGQPDVSDRLVVGNILGAKIEKWQWDESGNSIVLFFNSMPKL